MYMKKEEACKKPNLNPRSLLNEHSIRGKESKSRKCRLKESNKEESMWQERNFQPFPNDSVHETESEKRVTGMRR